jgi:hypothetical protein
VPPGISKCPICATELQKVTERRTSVKVAPSRGDVDDYLHMELPKLILPVAKHACPQCALELRGGEAKCPRCGIPLVAESEMLECPECGALAPPGAKSCPRCGVGFEEEPEVPGPPPIEEIPPSPILEAPAAPRKPLEPTAEVVTAVRAGIPSRVSEGLINGRGAVNGTGLVNGKGVVNGTGLVNGTGMTNGTRVEGRLTRGRGGQLQVIRRWQFMAVLVALAIIIPTFIYLSYTNEKSPVIVDGKFNEWAHVEKYGMYVAGSSTQTTVDQWAVETQNDKLFLYVKTQGELMASSAVNSLYLFVDSDNSSKTGYLVSGIGANYLLELDGWNGSVQSSSISEYGSASDPYNWTSWTRLGSLESVVSGNQLEAVADLPVAPSAKAKFLLFTQDNIGTSVSYPVQETGGLLVVSQESGAGIESTGVVAQSASVSLLKLKFTCMGKGGTINSVTPTVYGATLVSTFDRMSLAVGQNRTIDVLVDTSSLAPGTAVAALVTRSGVVSTFGDLRIVGEPAKAYVASPPATIQIDGAFADWAGRTTADTDAVPVGNENIDIDAVGAVNSSASSYFYVSVVGEMCSGSYVPALFAKPSGGGGGGMIIPTRKTGEDMLRVYIDSDLSAATGYQLSISSKTIGADYLVEIRGLDGEIKSKTLSSYGPGQWNLVAGSTVNAANDYHQIEVGVQSTLLSGSSSIDYIVETTDWRARSDLTTSTPLGTRALPQGSVAPPAIESWPVQVGLSNNDATVMSGQRKLFYDGTNIWSVFFNNQAAVLRYSTNSGRTWSAPTPSDHVFSTNGIAYASIWYDSTSRVLYTVGYTTSSDRVFYIRNGTADPANHRINWFSTDTTLQTSSHNMNAKYATICKDTSGYIWVLATNRTSHLGPYNLVVYRSSAVNSVASFVFSRDLLATADNSAVKGSIVPAGTGSNVWAVYTYNGNVACRKYTGTWSNQVTVLARSGTYNGPTTVAPPSVVVDSRQVVHVVYGNCYEQGGAAKPRMMYSHNLTGSTTFTSGLNLDSTIPSDVGDISPSISVDTATRNLWAIWIRTDAAGTGYTIMAKKNVSGTWTFDTVTSDTTSVKSYLISIYSAPSVSFICWEWTQLNATSYDVQFDSKIPEFGGVVVPVLFSVMILMVCVRRFRGSRED